MIEQVSVDSLVLRLAGNIDPALPARLASICDRLEVNSDHWLVDLVPSYTSLLVTWDPLITDYPAVRHRVLACLNESADGPTESAACLHRIPVWYSTRSGPDLAAVAQRAGISVDEVIRIHSETRYRVYALGFAPGFAFLGETDERIAVPRMQTPRTRVPAGSVAIANRQSAIYPIDSPGGWHLIGLSPVRLFDPKNLSLLNTGDEVEFWPVTEAEYREMAGGIS
jgi:KipI family sensor histidine kinase inhibitor